jgi:predicted ArsR family transcriptional regulator
MTSKTINAPSTKRGRATADAPKRVTKKDQLIRMLSGKAGAEIGKISAQLGWQPHTTRAALTRLKAAGYELASERSGEGRPLRYRISAKPATHEGEAPAGVADAG